MKQLCKDRLPAFRVLIAFRHSLADPGFRRNSDARLQFDFVAMGFHLFFQFTLASNPRFHSASR